MGSEDSKDLLKNVDWQTVGSTVTTVSGGSTIRKRLPKKVRQVPEYYFLPRRSLPSTIAIYGACCAAGVGAGMLLEVWIKKKIKGTSFPVAQNVHYLVALLYLFFFSLSACAEADQSYMI
ncbi:hypothetical protein AXF42_Ash020926 [Apostasia shenzhenica]|uniref:Uncharacterized protein n=1 Tax=Apostasia shenzhenica TaxID=1088818 RepID=A0A2H9ZUG8_9ASPA|nr:hypothetical protein AXF42_Ash020926 [Apostasia shenzhenica]